MSNEIIVLTGLCRWANVPPRPAQKIRAEDVTDPKDADNSSYSIMIECSREQFKSLKAKKIPPGTLLHDDDETNTTYIRVRASKVRGEYEFPDPIVKNEDGTDVTENIGNGSTVQVAIELAENKGRGGKVLRLRGVKVLKLIPYADKGGSNDVSDALGFGSAKATATARDLPSEKDIFS